MNKTEFNLFAEKQCGIVQSMLVSKGDEYSRDQDAFSNFKEGVEENRKAETPIQVLEGYLAKHKVSAKLILEKSDKKFLDNVLTENSPTQPIGNKVSKELIDDKFNDIINYYILLKGLLYEIHGYKAEENQ